MLCLRPSLNHCGDDFLVSVGGCGIEGEDDSWDFGTGAGFYVDATEEKWKKNYRMYSYVTKEVSRLHIILDYF